MSDEILPQRLQRAPVSVGALLFLRRVSRRFPPGSVELPARSLRFPSQPTFSYQVKSGRTLEFVPFVRAGRYAACSNRASPLIALPLRVACRHLPLNLAIGRPFLSSLRYDNLPQRTPLCIASIRFFIPLRRVTIEITFVETLHRRLRRGISVGEWRGPLGGYSFYLQPSGPKAEGLWTCRNRSIGRVSGLVRAGISANRKP